MFLVKQHRWVFRYSHWLLAAGFACHTVFIALRYAALGSAPILNLQSALAFFSWCIVLAYLVFERRFKLRILGSFAAPLATFLLLLSSTMTWIEGPVRPLFKSLWLTVHIGSIFMGNGLFAIAFLVAVMYLVQERQIKRKQLGPV